MASNTVGNLRPLAHLITHSTTIYSCEVTILVKVQAITEELLLFLDPSPDGIIKKKLQVYG